MILKREGYRFDMDRVFDAAAAHGVALEINSQVDRLDLDGRHARRRARPRREARDRLRRAHAPAALGVVRWGVAVARRAWLEPADILNTRPVDEFRASLRRRNTPSTPHVDGMTMDPTTTLAEIRRLYFKAPPATIDRDFDRAIDLLKSLPEAEREKATVYMEGLAEMRKEWGKRGPR